MNTYWKRDKELKVSDSDELMEAEEWKRINRATYRKLMRERKHATTHNAHAHKPIQVEPIDLPGTMLSVDSGVFSSLTSELGDVRAQAENSDESEG